MNPLNVSATLDILDFNLAYEQYVAVTGKDLAYCANRQALNVTIKTGRKTPLASRAKIKALVDRPWWDRFVAKKIRTGKGVRIKDGRTKGGNAKFRRVTTYTVDDARRVSEKLIQTRLNRIGFIRSGWLPALLKLNALKLQAKDAFLGGTSKIQKPKGDARVAVPGVSPIAYIMNNSQGAEIVGRRALQNGIYEAAVDMRGYCAKKMGETARKFSAH